MASALFFNRRFLMTQIIASVANLEEYQTIDLIPLGTRSPDTYVRYMLSEGNSILSSLYIESMDAGATIEVNYWDTTTGDKTNERYELNGHSPISGVSNYTDRILVTKIHNKPNIEVIVSGGNVRFGIYATIVSSFASDLDSALVYDHQSFVSSQDKALIGAYLHEASNELRVIRGTDNGIKVDIGSAPISGIFNEVRSRFYGSAVVIKNDITTIINETISSDTFIQRIICSGDGQGEFTIYINSEVWAIVRNSWQNRFVVIEMGGKKLVATDMIKIDAKNINISNQNTTFDIFVYKG